MMASFQFREVIGKLQYPDFCWLIGILAGFGHPYVPTGIGNMDPCIPKLKQLLRQFAPVIKVILRFRSIDLYRVG